MVEEQTEPSPRNFWLGVVNGTLIWTSVAFLDPTTVLTVFALDLMGGSVIWVGILISLITMGTYWPQAILANVFESQPRYMPYYRLATVLRIIIRFGIWLAIVFVGAGQPLTLFIVVAVLLFAFTSAAGVAITPFFGIIGDTIPVTWRGKFFGMRFVLGGLASLGAGLYVKHVLSETSGFAFPDNYAHLALLTAITGLAGWGVFCFMKESPHPSHFRRLSLGKQLARGPRLFRRNANFRRLVRIRAFFEVAQALCLPFIVPFALQVGAVAKALVGLFLVARVLSFSGASILWSHISDKIGNRLLLLISGIGAVVLPAMVMLAPRIPQTPLLGGSSGIDLRGGYFVLVFVVAGIFLSSQFLGLNNYLLEISDGRTRPTYLGFYFSVLIPLAWMPLVGSLVIGNAGRYHLGFMLSLVAAVGLLVNAVKLGEPRNEEQKTPPGV